MSIDLKNGYRDLTQHLGHDLELVAYGRTCILTGAAGEDPIDCSTHDHEEPLNIAIECQDCETVLLDFDRPADHIAVMQRRIGKMYLALQVISKTPHIRQYLKEHDPKAWEQIKETLSPKGVTCRFCGYPLDLDTTITPAVWIDLTGGDCCPGDENLVNENELHVPND